MFFVGEIILSPQPDVNGLDVALIVYAEGDVAAASVDVDDASEVAATAVGRAVADFFVVLVERVVELGGTEVAHTLRQASEMQTLRHTVDAATPERLAFNHLDGAEEADLVVVQVMMLCHVCYSSLVMRSLYTSREESQQVV